MNSISLLSTLISCKGSLEAPEAILNSSSDALPPRNVEIRIDVIPSQLRDADNEGYRVLPQSLLPGMIEVSSSLNLGEVNLLAPVVQSGQLEAFQVNPYVASIPGESLPLPGVVQLRRLDTLQWYSTRTNDLGVFNLWSVPGTYQLDIIPDNPLLPIFSSDWNIDSPVEPIDIDLGAGVPIYGRVTSVLDPGTGETVPLVGAKVHVEGENGVVSVSAETDESGMYQVRVTPGQWSLVCEGRDSGKDPALRFPALEVGDLGLHQDVVYPTDLVPTYLEGQILRASGEPLSGASIRITSSELTGYEAMNASFITELSSGSSGTFIASLAPGIYTIEVIPPNNLPADDLLTPKRLDDVHIDGAPLGLVELGGPRTLSGIVDGPQGSTLGGARIDCIEVGFDGRSWHAFTDSDGTFELDVSDTALTCQANPPGDRSDLALLWKTIDAGESSVDFHLPTGQRVSGTVTLDGQPEAFVVVDVLDKTGRSLGSGLTLEDGVFSIAVDLESAQ